ERPVDSVPFGNTAKIDPERPIETHPAIGTEFNVSPMGVRIGRRGIGCRQNSTSDQLGSDRDIEASVRGFSEFLRLCENVERMTMDFHRAMARFAVHETHIAARFMKAHQSMNDRDLFEGFVDR